MKNLLLAVLLVLGIVSCRPVKYIIIDPKDSTELIKIKKRNIYQNNSINFPTPFYFNYLNSPYYNPFIIQRHRPIIILPRRPFIQQPRGRR